MTHRPSEGEGDDQLALLRLVGLGVRLVLGLGEREGRAAEHGRGGVAERAGPGGRDVVLVLLEAEAEARVAGRRARGEAPCAARPAPHLEPRVVELQQLQLEEARAGCRLREEEKKRRQTNGGIEDGERQSNGYGGRWGSVDGGGQSAQT